MTLEELEQELEHLPSRWWKGLFHSADETATVISAFALVQIAKSLAQIAERGNQ